MASSSSSEIRPKYLEEESLAPENEELISSLPRENGWIASHLYQYQGFWYTAGYLESVISCQKHFEAHDSDVFLVTTPKSGTTWLKALMFALMNRERYPIAASNDDHPLLTQNPHDLVPFLEIKLYADHKIPDATSFPDSPRLFSSHMPYVSLPESIKKCKLVYLCRSPKDTFVSMWHFTNKLRLRLPETEIGEVFDRFCNGVSLYGPFWDHVLEYWKQCREKPERVFFLKYEDMKKQPHLHLRRLAHFLNCPFTADEEEAGLRQILNLCSFDNLSALEVNKRGALSSGVKTSSFFRRGEVGDWKNYLTAEMVRKLDQITRDNFCDSGLDLL